MLAGLRHDALIRGDHEEGEVDARRTCNHRVDQALMPGHVNKVELEIVV